MAAFRSVLRWLALAAGTAAGAATLFAFAGRWWWGFELLTHFRPHYVAVLAVGAIVCLGMKRPWFAALFCVSAAYNFALILPLYIPTRADGAGGQPVRLLLANLREHNEEHERFLRLVADTSPDIIVALEVDVAWLNALQQLVGSFPYQAHKAQHGSFGIAVFSRLPAERLEVRLLKSRFVPWVLGTFQLDGGAQFSFIAAHVVPPVTAGNAERRIEQLEYIGQLAATLPRPTVLAGDLNSTSWSPYFRDLLAATRLRDSRRGFGIQPTWPGPLAWLGIPIDHVLVSPEIHVVRRVVGPQIGSDHRPVVIDLVVPTGGK
jgi:endonuclease/exonuclease/phosphatase (EEP) superfamily protein YafD